MPGMQAPEFLARRLDAWYARWVTSEKPSILHISSRDSIQQLRDQIFRLHGFEVSSTISAQEALDLFRRQQFSLVLIDVEGEGRVKQAEDLCGQIRGKDPEQKVAFLCNYRVAIDTDCPDEVIRAEFNPEALVRGVQQMIQ